MTSTEFAAKYRLLKNVATRGARSFLAQQVALGRMVMVHYLDAEPAAERGNAVARLEGLARPARDKLLELVNVDGSPVAVTLFISSFVDFSSWLDQVAGPASTEQLATPPSAELRYDFNSPRADRPADLSWPPVPAQKLADSSGPNIPLVDSAPADTTAPRAPIVRAPDVVRSADSKPADDAAISSAGRDGGELARFDQDLREAGAHGGEFTQFFGKITSPSDVPAVKRSAQPSAAEGIQLPSRASSPPEPQGDFSANSPTLIIEAVKPPLADFGTSPAPTPSVPPPLHPPALDAAPAIPVPPIEPTPAESKPPAVIPQTTAPRRNEPEDASFTAIFGAAISAAPAASPNPPSFAPQPQPGRVMPFALPEPERPVQSAPPPAAPPLPAGEFTQLFQRLNVGSPTPVPANPGEVGRSPDASPRDDVFAAPPMPKFELGPAGQPIVTPQAANGGAMMAPMSMPSVPTVPADPLRSAPAWGGSVVPVDRAPSDFTRIMGAVSPGALAAAASPPAPVAHAAPAPAATETSSAESRGLKTYLPLILALNVVVVATIAIVLYFVLKR